MRDGDDTGEYGRQTGGFVKPRPDLFDSVQYLANAPRMPYLSDPRIAAMRRFNRFYVNRIGILREGMVQSRFSLTEARVLYELASRTETTATSLRAALDLDAGYLSRILRSFEQEGLLIRTPSATDRRRSSLTLTDAGRTAFLPLDYAAGRNAGAMLDGLTDEEQANLLDCMRRIEAMLGGAPPPPWTLRPPRPGDIGWVVQRHGALYAGEYGFNEQFEALVAQVAGAFLAQNDPVMERCWIAERDGMRLGSVFLVRQSEEVGRLRLLLVDPAARGLGLGKHLVAVCIEAARDAGYRRLTLWTNDILLAARGIYQAAGFRMVAGAPHHDFGPPMIGEDWDLDL